MFRITAGSIPGSDHTMPGKPGWKNNQDAYYLYTSEDFTIGIVADGCGSGERSEVGASLGVKLLGAMLTSSLARSLSFGNEFNNWNRLRMELLGQISVLARSMGESFSSIIGQYFLFSLLGFVVTDNVTTVFHAGDGSYMLNGRVTRLGPFPNNAPPYLLYSLLGDNDVDFQTITFPTQTVETIAVMTDGIDYISNVETVLTEWLDSDAVFSNPDLLRRKLTVMNCEKIHSGMLIPGPLKDDTTVVLARK